MHRILKKLLLLGVVAVFLVVVAAILIIYNLDKLVKVGVEKGGTSVLGVPITLENASVSVLRGTLGLNGLRLGSPEGFDAPEMFELAHAHVKMDLWSLRREEILVHEVIIDGPEVTLELAGGKTNWGVLLQHLKEQPSRIDKQVRVDRILFTNGKIKIAGLPLAGIPDISLPTVEVRDLRTADGKGVTVRKALLQVIEPLYKSILGPVKGVLPGVEADRLADEFQSALGEARGVLEEATSTAQEAMTEGTEKAKTILKEILGRETDDRD